MRIGVIGLGLRMRKLFESFKDLDKDFKIVAIYDLKKEKILEETEEIKELIADSIRFYDELDVMLETEELDGVFIGTPCNFHTSYAIKVMEKNIPLYLEKPVSINFEQLKELEGARRQYQPKVVVSFPLRMSPLGRAVKEIIESGKIGTVEQVQAFNDVPYGRVYYQGWYRNDRITGGMWPQKSTHDLDFINYIVDKKPVQVCAMSSKQIFKGTMPAGLKCQECSLNKTCPEGPYMVKNVYDDTVAGEFCCFATDTGNHDSGSVLIRYEDGSHGLYSQNFFVRKKAARRGARIYGYKGTLEYDWYRNEIKVLMHTKAVVETYQVERKGSHFGGDILLATNFLDLMQGRESISSLKDGIESVILCLCAKESCKTKKFIDVPGIETILD